ncbi:hypothetical protein E4U42_002016 [Claviceps africana]|uniref:Uncharacterized protein n=1 Tax=Claviceps africana TaxID=83212 RepID=A0A8K0J980_9HYPO|nr:hypothetical protein E4U42_002016 [Claviceps africana]
MYLRRGSSSDSGSSTDCLGDKSLTPPLLHDRAALALASRKPYSSVAAILALSISYTSVESFETKKQPTCVTHNTSGDKCALHSFIVWEAVKRNASPKMTSKGRRECLLLDGRKRLSSHELMFQHRYSYEHVETC